MSADAGHPQLLDLMFAVRDLRLGNKAAKSVLQHLLAYAARGTLLAYPAVATLAAGSDCGERTVRRALRVIEGLGLISCVDPGGGKHRTTVYRIEPDAIFDARDAARNVNGAERHDRHSFPATLAGRPAERPRHTRPILTRYPATMAPEEESKRIDSESPDGLSGAAASPPSRAAPPSRDAISHHSGQGRRPAEGAPPDTPRSSERAPRPERRASRNSAPSRRSGMSPPAGAAPHRGDWRAQHAAPDFRRRGSTPTGGETAAPSSRSALWGPGLAGIRRLTGKSAPAARALLGRLLADAEDDTALVSGLIAEAVILGPADPVAWLHAAIARRTGKRDARRRPPSALDQWVALAADPVAMAEYVERFRDPDAGAAADATFLAAAGFGRAESAGDFAFIDGSAEAGP